MNIPDPLPLRCEPIPSEVTRVEGCNCRGMTMHRTDCTIWDLPDDQAMAAVRAAEDRVSEYIAALNARLHQALS
jgi:hypothetical protein